MTTKQKGFEANFAITLRAGEDDDLDALQNSRFLYSAWKKRHWPTDVVRPGVRIYGFNTESRRLCVLLKISRGGAFQYSTKKEFVQKVKNLTGWVPDKEDRYWSSVPTPAGNGKHYSGVALRWKVIKRVSIPLKVRFPQLGWLKLNSQSSLQEDFDLSERYMEGDKRLRQHIAIERNQTLRKRARDYWYHHLGGLRCIACGFDFGRAYGPLGADFIEMHHDRPLAASPMGRKVGVTDLKPLCSNCHRMVHRRQKGLVSVSGNLDRCKLMLSNGCANGAGRICQGPISRRERSEFHSVR